MLREQPKPNSTKLPVIEDTIGKVYSSMGGDIARYSSERTIHGFRKYGIKLAPDNGRDSEQDLLDELYDASLYAFVLYREQRRIRWAFVSFGLAVACRFLVKSRMFGVSSKDTSAE